MNSLFRHKKDKGSNSGAQSVDPKPTARPPAANQAVPSQGNSLSHTAVARNLWKEAFESLSEEDRELLPLAGRDGEPSDEIPQQIVAEVMGLTESKYKEYCHRGWHTKKGDITKETNVQIKVQEIICSALQFRDLVDAGLKFDPSGYGTIVWSVVSGALTLVQNYKEEADAVFDSAAVMARFLPKYAIIEDHYRDRPTQEQKVFEDQIEQVYVTVFKYAACVKKELDRSVAGNHFSKSAFKIAKELTCIGRVLDSFWTLDNQDVKKLKVDLESKDKIVTDQSQLVAHQYRKQEFQGLHHQASETLKFVETQVEEQLKAQRRSTLEWLFDDPQEDKQQKLRSQIDKANKDSGKWLLESNEYTNWLANSHSFVWLHGPSGCGKSCLCSTVIKSLEESAEKDSNMIVAYWYFDNADSRTQDLQLLLRSVLRRISAKATPFPETVGNLANKHELPGSSPSTTALIKTLEETVAILEEDIFLVLDAIDEYHADNETLREEFLNVLVGLGNAQMRKLHLLVSSIAENDIKNAFNRLQTRAADIDVEKPVSKDVDSYLDATIKKYAEDKQWSPKITHKISKTLKDDGRFRIVSLQLEDLRKCYGDDEIDAALKSIPRDIEDAYLRKLQSIASKDIRRVSHTFYWVSVAVRQLTTLELAAAPGVNLPNPEELTNICPSSMVRLAEQKPSDVDKIELLRQEPTKIVTFDHPSVKRFLYSRKLQQSGDERISQFFISEKTVNAEFASQMVDHLLEIKQSGIEPSILARSPFLLYVAQHWHEHFKDCGIIPGEDEVLKGKLLILFKEPMNPAYLNWIRVWNPERKEQDYDLTQDSCPSPLYMAIFLRFESISKHLVDNRSYINGAGGLMHTSLQLAVKLGYTEIAQELIAAGEDVDKTANDQPTALQMASLGGFIKLVESLVASRADVNLQSGRFGTALQAAAVNGHSEIVAILLEKGAKPDIVGGLFGTAIQAAATGGHSEVVKMLAAKDIAWDEKRDSVWHEAYDLWISRFPTATPQSFLSKDILEGSDIQRMLAGVLQVLSSLPAVSGIEAIKTRNTIDTKNLILRNEVRRQGQEEMESEHYVYRAVFWAMLFRCRGVVGRGFNGQNSDKLWSKRHELVYTLTTMIISRAPDQKAIEHSNSDALVAVRHELVECYALAFDVVAELDSFRPMIVFEHSINRLRERIERQNESYDSVMKIARLQEPLLEAAFLDPMHRHLLVQMQDEMRRCFQKFDTSMQQKLEEVEHRVVVSIRDILPSIIREEMQKLLAEQEGSTSLDDRGN